MRASRGQRKQRAAAVRDRVFSVRIPTNPSGLFASLIAARSVEYAKRTQLYTTQPLAWPGFDPKPVWVRGAQNQPENALNPKRYGIAATLAITFWIAFSVRAEFTFIHASDTHATAPEHAPS